MKKALFIIFSLLFYNIQQSEAQCNFTFTAPVGNTVNFTHSWVVTGTTIVDSIVFDYGDFTGQSFLGAPPTSSHTYSGPGTYITCMIAYSSQIGIPGSTPCFYCDTITIPPSAPCIITPNYSISVVANTATFTNNTTCPTCTSIFYDWNFDDGSPISNTISPVHAYLVAGTYYPCLDIIGINANGDTCYGALCDTIVTTVSACPANASFAASGSSLTKSFFNASSCVGCTGTNAWLWDFGDGTTSSIANPVHTYAAGGIYTVCLTITNTFGGSPCVDSFCTPIIVNSPGCTANAIFTPNIAGLTSSFTNNSTCINCSSTSYSWNFGDGSPLNTTTSPSHTYALQGTYNVCLTMNSVSTTGLLCADTFCAAVTILDPGLCAATSNFTATSNLLVASFTNTSTCTNCSTTTYSWNFGDGSPLDATTSPIHTYAVSGTYNVCLTVSGITLTGNTCTHVVCLPVTVQIPIGCASDAIFSNSSSGNTVSFVNASTCTSCTSTTYLWKFGDGGTSTWNSPSHNYTSNGTFNVCLYVTGYAANQTICKDSLCKQIGVSALGINDIDKKQLSIFPNPTTKSVVIALPINEDLLDLQLMDVTGRRLKTISLNSMTNLELEIDLSSYTAGLYMIQVSTKQSKYKAQIIKQ